jgi:hypothetical protein
MNLFSGRAIIIVQKFNHQPRMTFVSVSPVSAFSLAWASMSLHGRGSIGETSWETAVSPRRGAHLSRVALLVLLRLIVRPMKSSIYTSTMPLASRNVDNEVSSDPEWNVFWEHFFWWNVGLCGCCKKGEWIPIIVLQDCIHQIAH